MHLSFVRLLQVTVLTPSPKTFLRGGADRRPVITSEGGWGIWSELLRRGSEASGTEANGFSNRILKDGGAADTASKVLE